MSVLLVGQYLLSILVPWWRSRWATYRARRASRNQGPWGRLVLYDWRNGIERPYVLTVPSNVLSEHLDRSCQYSITPGLFRRRKQLWIAEQPDNETIRPVDLGQKALLRRTPQYVSEYMQLRPDRALIARSSKGTDRLVFGAMVGVVITSVFGLVLINAIV